MDTDRNLDQVSPIPMPEAGNTMEEGTVLQWFVKEGDSIDHGQIICEIETDKASIDYESPVAGRLARVVAAVNEPIPVKQVIAVIAESDEAADAFLASASVSAVATDSTSAPIATASPAEQITPAVNADQSGRRVKASPAARRIAMESGVALARITAGSGPGGRILSTDVEHHATNAAGQIGNCRPLSKMRRAIGVNLQRSKQTIPHFYMKVTINAEPIQVYCDQQNSSTGCSLNDVVVLAVGRAMREFPAFRSQIEGDQIVEFPHANIGIAVGVDEGLVVPVVLQVDTLSLAEISAETKRVIEAGRTGTLENIGQGNFTVTNLGMFGVEEFSAIINPPESGILAIGAIRGEVIVENGWMRPGKVMTMTLSANHHVLDGVVAAKFMGRLQQILEQPAQELS